jgi:pimeloyl-ACP methyl ester carboxylesterase
MLHGLAGFAGEWKRSAELLIADYHVFALDQRGHGESERAPVDVSRDAYVEDVAATIGHLGLGPVTLIGQSMGANTAMLTASRHPDLVTALVMVEGTPDGPGRDDPSPAIAAEIRDALSRWPIPFPDADAAHRFFESKGFDPHVWTEGLEPRADGLWPRFDVETLVRCMSDLGSRDYWQEWCTIRCPALVVLGSHGMVSAGQAAEMEAQLPGAKLVTIEGAGHDVHLDAPRAMFRALEELMDVGT